MDLRQAALELYTSCEHVTKDVALVFIETYLREIYLRGRDDYHNQLSNNIYPRR